MSYEKYDWHNGEIITADKLNHMEDGIVGGSGAKVEYFDILHWDEGNLVPWDGKLDSNKEAPHGNYALSLTYREIKEAMLNGTILQARNSDAYKYDADSSNYDFAVGSGVISYCYFNESWGRYDVYVAHPMYLFDFTANTEDGQLQCYLSSD